MKGKKMKTVKAWALVFRDNGKICGWDTDVLQPYLRRADARGVFENRRAQYGDIFRIARIEIREVS